MPLLPADLIRRFGKTLRLSARLRTGWDSGFLALESPGFDEPTGFGHKVKLGAATTGERSLTVFGSPHHFACDVCDSPSITVPHDLHDAAELHCANCGASVGSWSALKERIRQVILREIDSSTVSAERASSDLPLRCLERWVSLLRQSQHEQG